MRAEIDFTCGTEIGAEGKNSRVFLATDHQLDAEIVVKRIERSSFKNEDEFFAEARRLYDARHAHVVPVKFACKTDDHVFIAMPFYSGGSVQALLKKRHVTVREIVRFGLHFLTGIHHIHTRGLIHFDVKPSNVLIDGSGKASLTDFGLSRYVDEYGLAEQDVMYVLHRPPEALLYDKLSPAADIYQAGLTLYRMATGAQALEAQWGTVDQAEALKRVIAGRLPDRRAMAYPAHIPSRLRTAIRKALEPDPEHRYGTVLELANALGAVDEWLDWRYEAEEGGGLERWWCRSATHEKLITLRELSRTAYEVRAETLRLDNGSKRSSHKLSGDAGTRAQARGLVQAALTNL